MKVLSLFYYYLLANGLVLFGISTFRIKKNPASKYFFLQYILLLALVAEFVSIEYIFRRFSFYCYADFPIRFLLAPFIYLYVCTYTNPQYRPSKKILVILFTPAVIELFCFIAISIYYYQHPHSYEDRLRIANNSTYYFVRTFLALLFNLLCIYFAYRRIRIFSWNIFKVLSNLSRLRFGWLKVILGISVFLWLYWLVTFFCEAFFRQSLPVHYMYYVLYLLIALVVLVFGYFAILKPYVAEAYLRASTEIESIKPMVAINIPPAVSLEMTDSKPLLTEEPGIFRQYFTKLEEYIASTGKFKSPEITLAEIAKELNTTSFNISKAIKLYSREGSFYEYINRYRLLHFLQLIGDPKNDQFTINALALKSGFTSTTTLNKYCKKITGLTPAKAKILLTEGKSVEDLLNG